MDEQEETIYYKTTSEFFSELSRLNIHLIQEFFDSVCKSVVKEFNWQVCEIFEWHDENYKKAGLKRKAGWAKNLNQHIGKIEALVSKHKDLEDPSEGVDYYPWDKKSATINCMELEDILLYNDIRQSPIIDIDVLKGYEKDYGPILLGGKLKAFIGCPIIIKHVPKSHKLGLLRLMNKYKVIGEGKYETDNINEKYEREFFKNVADSIKKAFSNRMHHKNNSEVLTKCAKEGNLEEICKMLSNTFSADVKILNLNDSRAKKASKYLSQIDKSNAEYKPKVFTCNEKEVSIPIFLNKDNLSHFIYLNRNEKYFNEEEKEIFENIGDFVSLRQDLKVKTRELENQKISYLYNTIVTSMPQKMQFLFKEIIQVSNTNSSVLITGESGTGKELVARAIHYNSLRKEGPLVAINCAALPENLLESELFGYEKGAFTGAEKCKKGRFEMADGGTLFLDEISEMNPLVQAKLLRVLEESEFERVGGTEAIKINIRIITATNKNLEQQVKEGKFREDIFYRINVVHLTLPPLRERKEDIPVLIEHFLGIYNQIYSKTVMFSKEALLQMEYYIWPGNVRELKNFIESKVVLTSGNTNTINLENLPDKMKEETEKLPENLREHKMLGVLKAMRECGWNKTQAAKKLGLTRDGIRLMLYKYMDEKIDIANGDIDEAARLAGMTKKEFQKELNSRKSSPNLEA